MTRFDVVLVPTDASQESLRAVPVARGLAEALGAKVRLLSAVAKEDDIPEREAELDGIEGVAGSTVVVDLDAAAAIHNELRRLGTAVAVMATHGRGRSAALVGSVATDVVTRGRDPVVVVGPLVGEHPPGPGVVGCIDDSPEAAGLVEVTKEWAGLLGEPPIVVTVAEPVPDPVRPGAVVHRLWGPDGDPTAFLSGVAGDVEQEVIWDPVGPVEGMDTYLHMTRRVRMVVVGAVARPRLARLVLGSTAAGIVRRSPYPVLVVPEEELA
jgi:nucleotide-binding universal stress UspA family protein